MALHFDAALSQSVSMPGSDATNDADVITITGWARMNPPSVGSGAQSLFAISNGLSATSPRAHVQLSWNGGSALLTVSGRTADADPEAGFLSVQHSFTRNRLSFFALSISDTMVGASPPGTWGRHVQVVPVALASNSSAINDFANPISATDSLAMFFGTNGVSQYFTGSLEDIRVYRNLDPSVGRFFNGLLQMRGRDPAWLDSRLKHRWKLAGDLRDSVGSAHGTPVNGPTLGSRNLSFRRRNRGG